MRLSRYILVIILILMALFLTFKKIQYREVVWPEAETIKRVTISPTSGPRIEDEYPLWKLLPYQGEAFVIERYIDRNTLAISTKLNQKKVTEEVYKWLIENKEATESYKLVFED